MSQNAIVVENLSKRYLIGHRHTPSAHYNYVALRDVIAREARNFARKAADVLRGRQVVQGDDIEEFWALRDVNFEVKEGEVLGIIGRNGAGKSTLLKILSRITEPTEGRILLHGRVASLLEVGTGFHPELTGRENIFLNGAILGMTQQEIRKKFDEIVAFAEVDKFLDTPVKHYSSGMYVRLAFAVAAHLDPEILIVDEVLAVGDAKFQAKCLEKMKNVAADGRTILLVSHNMTPLLQLTTRVLLLSDGAVELVGPASKVIEHYSHYNQTLQTLTYDASNASSGTGEVKILSLRFQSATPYFEFLEPIRYFVRIVVRADVGRLRVGMTVFAEGGTPVGNGFSSEISGLAAGEEREILVELASVPLAPGRYSCAVSVGSGNHRTSVVDYDLVLNTLDFEVLPERIATGGIASWSSASWGSICFSNLTISLLKNSGKSSHG